MVQEIQAGALSIVPALVAIGLAWDTRDALITACLAAVLFLLLGVALPEGFRVIPY